MKKRITLILASMLLAMGAWAETTVYKVNEATTTLTDGTYVLVAMSDNGTGPCYYSSAESGNRFYRYDVNKEVQVGGYIDGAQYIWTIDETTTNGTQKITVTNVGDPTKAFPVDAAINNNFQGSGVAELIPELHTINGVDYLALTLENTSVGYIHANAPGGNPNLSYWNSYADGGTCVKFRFYPVEAAVVADRTITYTLTDMAGNSYEGTFEGHEGDVPTFTGVADYSLDNIQWSENSLTATITFPFPVSSASITNQVIICPFAKDGTNKYFADGTSVKANRNNTMPFATNVAAENYLWAFYPELIDGTTFRFRIKNIGTGTYLSSESTANDHSGDEVSLVSDETNSEAIFFTVTANKQIRNCKGYDLSVNSEANSSAAIQYVGTYNTNHNGTKNKIINANNYTLTDGAGNEYVGTNGVQNLPAIGTYTDGAWGDNGYSATVTFPFSVSSAEVTNETMIANFNATQRWHAVGSDVKVQTEVPTVATMDEWMWAIYPTFEEGKFTFKVKNMSTGTYVTVNKNTSSFDTQGTVTLTGEGTELEVITWLGSPCFIVSGSNYVYLTINGTLDTDVFLATWTGGNNSHAGNKLHFPNPTYNVTITDAKAATLTTPFAVSLPTGVTAGYVNGVDTEKQILTYTDVTAIPAGESVVLFGEAGIYTFNKTENAEDFTSENYLVGYNVATDIPEGQTVYALGDKSNGVAFYTFTGTQYAAGKAYLQLPVAEAKAIGYFNVFGGEGTTGIGNAQLTMDNENVVIYDLQGRRVEQMEKGIYIVNGKKIIK